MTLKRKYIIVAILTSLLIALLIGRQYKNYLYENKHSDTTDEELLIKYTKHYCNMDDVFSSLPADSNNILLVGDSFIDHFRVSEYFSNKGIRNRGIKGELTFGVIDNLHLFFKGNPQKIIFYIGINDIINNVNIDTIESNYRKIINVSKKYSKTKIYFVSLLPIRNKSPYCNNCNDEIKDVNKRLKLLCKKDKTEFIDIYSKFLLNSGIDTSLFIEDGLHLNGKGYCLFANCLRIYIDE